jgi:hypothetical protein
MDACCCVEDKKNEMSERDRKRDRLTERERERERARERARWKKEIGKERVTIRQTASSCAK